MPEVKFTNAARKDLSGIFEYTERTWGYTQAKVYSDHLKQHLAEISVDETFVKKVAGAKENVFQSKCRKHIFVFERKADTILIVRILHEAMDVPRHIKRDS